MAVKTCAKCRESKPTSKYFPSVATSDGLKPICTTCYFELNNGRSPRGFRYITPPGTIKVWVTHGSLWNNLEGRVTIAEAVPRPNDPLTVELLPPRWDDEGGLYRKPDWHTSEADAFAELQRLVDELVEDRRKEYVAACAVRSLIRAGKGLKISYR